MSWDVSIYKFSKQYTSVDEIEEEPISLGEKDIIIKTISEYFPSTDWSCRDWGIFDSSIGSIEFNIGDENLVESIGLHVRANCEIVHPIIKMCTDNGWQALDVSICEFIDQISHPEEGLLNWQNYLNSVMNKA